VAKEGRSVACEEGGKEKVQRVRREQPRGAKVPLSEVMGRRMGPEKKVARRRRKSDQERSAGGEV